MNDEGILPAQTIWLDPGQVTGWAYLTDHYKFHSGQNNFMSLGTQLEMACSIHGESLWIGWESFVINPATASKHGSEWPLQVIGVARYLAEKYECTMLPPRAPATRELGSLQKLKRLGWYTPGQPHANDAASHLLAYMISSHALPQNLLEQAMTGDNSMHVAG